MSCNPNDHSTLFSSLYKQKQKNNTNLSFNDIDFKSITNSQINNSFIYLILYMKELLESGLYDHSLRILKNDMIKSVFLNSPDLKIFFNCIQLGITKLHLFQLVSNDLVFQYNVDISLLNEEFIDVKNEIDYNSKMKYMIIGRYSDVLQSLFYQNHLEPLLKSFIISNMEYVINNTYDNDYTSKIKQMTIEKVNFEDIILYYQSIFTYYSYEIKPKSIGNDLELASENFLMNVNPDVFIVNIDNLKEENIIGFVINKFINEEIINKADVCLNDLKINLNFKNSKPVIVSILNPVGECINTNKYLERDLYIKSNKNQVNNEEVFHLKKNLVNKNEEEIFISHDNEKYYYKIQENDGNNETSENERKRGTGSKDKYFEIKKEKKNNIFNEILLENKLKLTKKNRKLSIMNRLCFKNVKREKIDRYLIKYFVDYIQSDRKFNSQLNSFLKFLHFNKLKFPFVWENYEFKSENTSFLIFFFSHDDLYNIYDSYVSSFFEYINKKITELYKNSMTEFEIKQTQFYIMNLHKIYSLNYK